MNSFIVCVALVCCVSFRGSIAGWVEDNCGVGSDKKCCPLTTSATPGEVGCLCRCAKPAVNNEGTIDEDNSLYCKVDEGAWPNPKDKKFRGPSCGVDMKQVCCEEATEARRKTKKVESSESESESDSMSMYSTSSLSESEEQPRNAKSSNLKPWYDATERNPTTRDSNLNSDSEAHSHSHSRYTSRTLSESEESTQKSKKTREDNEEATQCQCRCKEAIEGKCAIGKGRWYHGDGGNPDSGSEEEGGDGANSAKTLDTIYWVISPIIIIVLII